jgi:hypothetical protein
MLVKQVKESDQAHGTQQRCFEHAAALGCENRLLGIGGKGAAHEVCNVAALTAAIRS